MSDTKYSTVAVKFRKIDKIDEEWLKDQLSDDEIEFPKGVAIPSAEEQDEAEEEKSEVEEGWADMNLDVFLKE